MGRARARLLDAGGAVGGGRPAASRPLLAEALGVLPLPEDGERPLLAIEFGLRGRLDSLELLRRGWTVLAIVDTPRAKQRLLADVSQRHSARLTVEVGDFDALALPSADLVYIGAYLHLRPPSAFGPVWGRIVPAIRPGGWLVGQFLGDRDSRAPDPSLTFLTRRQVITLLSGFLIELLREREISGAHAFDVIARRRPIRSPS